MKITATGLEGLSEYEVTICYKRMKDSLLKASVRAYEANSISTIDYLHAAKAYSEDTLLDLGAYNVSLGKNHKFNAAILKLYMSLSLNPTVVAYKVGFISCYGLFPKELISEDAYFRKEFSNWDDAIKYLEEKSFPALSYVISNKVGLQKPIFAFVGGSGSGKSTVAQQMAEKNPGLYKVVTATTRDPRDGEKNWIDYNFMTKPEFKEEKFYKMFVETNYFNGHFYGLPKNELNKGYGQIIVIEPYGLEKLQKFAEAQDREVPEDERREKMISRGDSVEEVDLRLSKDKIDEMINNRRVKVEINLEINEYVGKNLHKLVMDEYNKHKAFISKPTII